VGVPDLVNGFSWSRSRDNLFQECRRKYYYHYYGSWGGWEPDADAEVRRLYVLKQLSSRQQWAGKLVHEGIELLLRALRSGSPLPETWLITEIVKRMRREWKASHHRRYWDDPKGGALFEHEYSITVSDETWQQLRDHLARCLRNFYRLDLLSDIRQTPLDRWILIEEIRAFNFEGTPVYGAPDFGYWTSADRLALVDWKTGGGNGEMSAFQLGIYALYAQEVLGAEPARVDLFEVNLREPTVRAIPWDEAKLSEVMDRLRLSIRSMKAWLRDPSLNLAVMEDFEKTEELRLCKWCNFRAVCRPELDLGGGPAQLPPSTSTGQADRGRPNLPRGGGAGEAGARTGLGCRANNRRSSAFSVGADPY